VGEGEATEKYGRRGKVDDSSSLTHLSRKIRVRGGRGKMPGSTAICGELDLGREGKPRRSARQFLQKTPATPCNAAV